jgi:hypothetical protein
MRTNGELMRVLRFGVGTAEDACDAPLVDADVAGALTCAENDAWTSFVVSGARALAVLQQYCSMFVDLLFITVGDRVAHVVPQLTKSTGESDEQFWLSKIRAEAATTQ